MIAIKEGQVRDRRHEVSLYRRTKGKRKKINDKALE